MQRAAVGSGTRRSLLRTILGAELEHATTDRVERRGSEIPREQIR
jgi:hypothetical protein|tara:strand:+ start:448 stop:582 length:135 start_codon:yes stop_codon:yes gene_type:complete